MLALEVYLNGKRQCLAGIADDGLVSAILTWVGGVRSGRRLPEEDISLRVGGLDSVRREHLDWLRQDLAAGDEVRIRVVDVPKVDRPIKGSRRPADVGTRSQKAYFRRMAKKFGWTIVTKRSR